MPKDHRECLLREISRKIVYLSPDIAYEVAEKEHGLVSFVFEMFSADHIGDGLPEGWVLVYVP